VGNGLDVYVSGGYAYVADGLEGLRVIDVSDPERPYEVGYYDTPGDACVVCAWGSYVYVADGWAGLRVIDVTHLQYVEEVGHWDTPGRAKGVLFRVHMHMWLMTGRG